MNGLLCEAPECMEHAKGMTKQQPFSIIALQWFIAVSEARQSLWVHENAKGQSAITFYAKVYFVLLHSLYAPIFSLNRQERPNIARPFPSSWKSVSKTYFP